MLLEKKYSELCRDLDVDYMLNLPEEKKKLFRGVDNLKDEIAILEQLLEEKRKNEEREE